MSTRRHFIESTAFGALALSTPAVAVAQAQPANLRVIFFGVASNLPVWCAISKGFFARENLTVTTEITPGSQYMFEQLSVGNYQIAVTAFDNDVAYDEGQGAVQLPNNDFVAFLGGDNGMLSLLCRADLKTYGDLRGETLAVDALQTGFTFVLRRMMQAAGLGPNDYKLVAAGGTPKRYEGLVGGLYAATLLTAPFDLQAEQKGCHKIGTATDFTGHYQAYAGVTRKAWAASNGDVLVRYIRGYLAALRWLYDPRNKDATIAILTTDAKVPPDVAPQVYAEAINRESGITPNGAIDLAGVKSVLALRREYGLPKKTLADPNKYIDERYYRMATRR